MITNAPVAISFSPAQLEMDPATLRRANKVLRDFRIPSAATRQLDILGLQKTLSNIEESVTKFRTKGKDPVADLLVRLANLSGPLLQLYKWAHNLTLKSTAENQELSDIERDKLSSLHRSFTQMIQVNKDAWKNAILKFIEENPPKIDENISEYLEKLPIKNNVFAGFKRELKDKSTSENLTPRKLANNLEELVFNPWWSCNFVWKQKSKALLKIKGDSFRNKTYSDLRDIHGEFILAILEAVKLNVEIKRFKSTTEYKKYKQN